MSRLSVVDEIFLRTHRGLGTPIALQGLWRTADRVEHALLYRVHAELSAGPLGRRVIRPRVPGARRTWQPTTRAHPLELTTQPIPVADLLDWANIQGENLDPEYGPGWRLSATPLDDGGSIVSLTCSHALADGRALVLAIDDALRRARERAPEPWPPADSAPPNQRSVGGTANHLADALTKVSAPKPNSAATEPPGKPTAVGSTASPTGVASPRDRTSMLPAIGPSADARGRIRDGEASPTGAPDPSGMKPTAVMSNRADARGHTLAEGTILSGGSAVTAQPVPRDAKSAAAESDWADARRQWWIVLRGTMRALRGGIPRRAVTGHGRDAAGIAQRFVPYGAVLSCPVVEWDRVAADHGGTANSLFVWLVAHMLWSSGFPGESLTVSLPVDTRDEPRVDNDLAMTEIAMGQQDTLATIREKCRAAYEYRMSSPGGMPEEILQVIPDRWAYALSRGAGERDILCSNIGELPDSLRALGPHRCTGVAARAIHPGLTAEHLPRTRLSGYLCRIGDDYTLALVSLDPVHIASPRALRDLAMTTAATLRLPIAPW
ncbi:hypothetical protein [Nocardia sp. NPDC052566]|uniref:hypothetical protein n=1 Tax=Nocardia sp. NPDC052566 TaxID=3364330 RepID=UPI0037C5D4E6